MFTQAIFPGFLPRDVMTAQKICRFPRKLIRHVCRPWCIGGIFPLEQGVRGAERSLWIGAFWQTVGKRSHQAPSMRLGRFVLSPRITLRFPED